MAYWHTAAPNSGEEYGWVGRLADAMRPDGEANFLINIDVAHSLAVRSRRHTPVVFDDPEKFVRKLASPSGRMASASRPTQPYSSPLLGAAVCQ